MKKIFSFYFFLSPSHFVIAQNEDEKGGFIGNSRWYALTRGSYNTCILESKKALNLIQL